MLLLFFLVLKFVNLKFEVGCHFDDDLNEQNCFDLPMENEYAKELPILFLIIFLINKNFISIILKNRYQIYQTIYDQPMSFYLLNWQHELRKSESVASREIRAKSRDSCRRTLPTNHSKQHQCCRNQKHQHYFSLQLAF